MKVHSLRAKLMLLFFIFFFIPYGVLTFFSISVGRGMMKKSTIDHLQNLVEVKETAIEQWLKERVSDGKAIAESQEIRSLNPKLAEPFLSLVKHAERSYLEIRVFNLKGQVVSGLLSKNPTGEGERLRKAMGEEMFVSTPALHPTSLKPVIPIFFRIRDARGRPIGVLEEFVDLTYISELISESKLGKTGKLYIVNPEGEFVVFNRLNELVKKKITKVSYFDKIEFEPTHTGVYTDYMGNEVLGSWKWIPNFRCYLIAEQDTKEAFYEINRLVNKAFFIFIVSIGFILGTSYWVIGRITGPVKHLSKAVASFAEGHFEKTISSRREDEIGKLIAGFNAMAEKLKRAYSALEGKVEASDKELQMAYQMLKERQEQLIRSEKMAALGQLSAGIAHEVRNPLTSFKIFIQSLEKEMDLDDHQKQDFRIIMREIDRINEKITRFLNFARPEEPLFQAIKVSSLLQDTINLMGAKLKSCGIGLDISLPDEHPPVEGDPRQLTQVFLNLFLNAVEAMPQGGTLTIRSAVKVDKDTLQETLQVIVKDTGHGISEKDQPYLFDPFFTTKAGGTGLGLSIVYSIIQKHNGRIEVESEFGKGSSFILSLPVQRRGAWNAFSSSTTT